MKTSNLIYSSAVHLLFSALVLLCSCADSDSNNSGHTQDQAAKGTVDTAQARKIVNQFYSDLEQKKYDVLSGQFSGRTSKEEATDFFVHLDTTMGHLEKFEIVKITGTPADSGRSTYSVDVFGQYENCKTHDNLVVIIGQNGHTYDRFVSLKSNY